MNKNMIKLLISGFVWVIVGISAMSYIESEKILDKPSYLTEMSTDENRYIGSESSVFDVIDKSSNDNLRFSLWFNDLSEEHKRGFILYVRSSALSSLLGDMMSFSEEQWLSGRSGETARITKRFMKNNDLSSLKKEYNDIYINAEAQRELFLNVNDWLSDYLGENYEDFKDGLFYFFAEHELDDGGISTKSLQFSNMKKMVMVVSDAIIESRGDNTRISPKLDVSDSQIREIVAASFFTELFYDIPAEFMLLISAYETNFSMEFWHGGSGTTQQTMRAANTVLQSDYWIERAYRSSGIRIRYQMVPISALDNVFLCITEAAKTIAIKAAELRIKTRDIRPTKKVEFAGQLLPVTWATAYKYNGSQKYAKRYAGGIHYYYKTNKWWLRSIADNRYRMYAFQG
jgi:hypothetical protein